MSLTSDELGEKGESRFKELCADAKLICNKADRDRAGWDFIVEGHLSDEGDQSLDHRQGPLSCHVQVKTVGTGARAVRLKLNMAERLAKELKPSFICMIVVNELLEVENMFLLSMSQNRLEEILKRLRKHSAEVGSADRLNKSAISFTPTQAEKIEATGLGLRDAIERHCGPSMAAYAAEKQKQLSRLGYKGEAFQGTIKMPVLSSKEMGDIFLGLKKNVEVSDFEVFETRFGIRLLKTKASAVKVTISPDSVPCTVVLRAPGFAPVSMTVQMRCVAGAMTGGATRINLRNAICLIDLYDGSGAESSEFDFFPAETAATLSELRKAIKALQILQSGVASVELISKAGKQGAVLQSREATMGGEEFFRRMAAVINGLEVWESRTGINFDDIKFGRHELISASDQVLMTSTMFEDAKLVVAVPAGDAAEAFKPGRVLNVGQIRFDHCRLAYAFAVDFECETAGGVVNARFSNFEFKCGRWIEDSDQAYDGFLIDAIAETGLANTVGMSCRVELAA